MRIDHTAIPDVACPDAGLALAGEWSTSGPEHQRRAADAALAAWQATGWPAGLLAHTCLLGQDGRSVLHYTQWAGENAARAFAGTGKPGWIRAVDGAVYGIEHRKVTAYQLYRNTTPAPGSPPAGCLVTVTIDFGTPDAQRQRDWVDNVFAAAGTDSPAPAAGMLAAHFHISVDGTRVLNLAEWTTAQAHRDAIAAPAKRFHAAVRQFPGVAGSAVQRYTPYRRITP